MQIPRLSTRRALELAALAVALSHCDAENLPATTDGGFASAADAMSADTATPGLAGVDLVTQGPGAIDFGTVDVGQQSATIPAVVLNSGRQVSTTLSAAIVGADAAALGIDRDGCSGQRLAPGSTCFVYMHFAPTWAGAAWAILDVQDGEGASVTVALTGLGVTAGSLVIAPTTLSFGAVAAGTRSLAQAVTLTNDGAATGPLTLALSGSQGGDFVLSDDGCSGQALDAGATCSVDVSFAPSTSQQGDETASLTASSGAATAAASLEGTASTPASFAVAPATYDFGDVTLGAQVLQQFTASNTGGVASGVPGVAVAGADAADFTVTSSTCTSAVAASASCTVSVVFQPSVAAAESATLAVGSTSVPLSGTGLVPAAIAISPASHAFASTTQGSASPAATFLVSNDGGVATGALTVGLGGTDGNQFQIDADTCTGVALAVSAACSITVHFAPGTSALGAVSASLHVGGAPGGEAAAALTGVAIAPAQLAVNSTNHGFGTVVWHGSAQATFTVTNTGGASTGSLSDGLSGVGTASFAVTADTCSGTSLAGGSICSVTVAFEPTSGTGAQNATLTVSATPGGSVATVLTGTAQQPGILVIAAPSPFSGFGTVAAGSTSSAATFTVTNSGGATTGTLTASLGGSNASQFTVSSDGCSGSTLAPQQTCTVAVEFSPATGTTGPDQATLTVSANPGGSAPASLSGTAAAPANLTITAPSAFSGFGTVIPPATSAEAKFTITNRGGVPSGPLLVLVAGTGTSASEFPESNDACTGNVLDAGASCTVAVAFEPSSGSTGSQQATLGAAASPGGAAAYTLTGIAGSPPDAGAPPPVDAGAPPPLDAGTTRSSDAATEQ